MTAGAPRVEDLELALASARAAGEGIMTSFRTDQEVRHKGPDQPVTDADLVADAVLKERLLAERPGYGWLSEETADRPERMERDRVWIVDPIDGTRSYVAGYAEFGVSIGLVEGGEPVLGVIYNPARLEVLWAIRGGGSFRSEAWTGGRDGGRRLRVEEPADVPLLLASRTEIARGELATFVDGWDIRPLGSTAWKMAGVASGAGHAFLSRGPKSEWDIAAGIVIVEEAGGVVTDLEGGRPRFNRPDPYIHGLLVATPGQHPRLLERSGAIPAPRLRGGRARTEEQ